MDGNNTGHSGSDVVSDPSTKISDTIFLVLVIISGVFGNLLTIISVTKLKSATNILVANISIADLLVCSYSVPTILVNRLAESNVVPGVICKLNAFALFSSTGVSNFSFTLIAIARNMCVLHQPAYRRAFTNTNTLIYSIVCWATWFALGGIFWSQKGFGYIPQVYLCFYYDDESPFALSFMLTLLGVAIPTVLAAGCYISLFVKLFQIRRESKSSIATSSEKKVSKEWRALAPVLTAFIVFNLCWGPYSIHVYYDKFVAPVGRMSHKIIIWLAVFNSTLNPVIFGLTNSRFRQIYARIARRVFCRCSNESAVKPFSGMEPASVSKATVS